jgi:hypothetical protein
MNGLMLGNISVFFKLAFTCQYLFKQMLISYSVFLKLCAVDHRRAGPLIIYMYILQFYYWSSSAVVDNISQSPLFLEEEAPFRNI